MCGISAVTARQDVVQTLFQSIKNLEYRGYDSCGLGLVHNGEIAVRKNVGGVDEVNNREHLTAMKGQAGIAHTRWATHGKVTRENAHPHNSADGRFSLVHNGIIENYQELRHMLLEHGVPFSSSTDTEVVVHLIAQAYGEFGDVEQAFLAAIRRLEGAYSICLISSLAPDTIFCMRNGPPLVLGLSHGQNFVASDVNAFLQHTKETMLMEDGEYAVVTPDAVRVHRLKDGAAVTRKPLHIDWDPETSRKGGYSHFMLKEIFDQPQTVLNALHIPRTEIRQMAQSIHQADTAFLTGVGTTYYVAMVGQYLFNQHAKRYLPAISSDEFANLGVMGPRDLLLSISQSGETFDTRRAVEHAKAQGARTASIVNVMGSSLSMSTDQVILQGSGPEICVVSTKAAMAQMLILKRIALELGLLRGTLTAREAARLQDDLDAFAPIVEKSLNELSGVVRNLAEQTVKWHNWLMMGRGIYYPIALESALKMKEVTYLHVEGMPAGFLKHGTLSMVDQDLISLFLLPPPEDKQLHTQTLSALEEVKARGGPVLGIYFEDDHQAAELLEMSIVLPRVPTSLAPFLELIVTQLFAYFAALTLRRSIDKPRNLAKSVTVG